MAEISYRRHRFPPVTIQHAVWLYLRFTLSYRDVEELLAERGLDISYETVRCWVLKFARITRGDRGFGDSLLEQAGFELLVPLATEATSERLHREICSGPRARCWLLPFGAHHRVCGDGSRLRT